MALSTNRYLCERPIRLTCDPEGRSHSHDGMAVQFQDGWSVYAWHGVGVPEQTILRPETLTLQQVLDEPNAEVRRVMIERHGLDRLLTHSRASVIDADQDGNRLLYRLNLSGDEPVVAVRVTCPSTGQIYFLRVPPDTQTCRAAVAWTFTPVERVSLSTGSQECWRAV